MDSPNGSRSSAVRRTRSTFLMVLVLAGVSLATALSVSADPATGPGAVSRVTAGALPSGVIPDGTCSARVTAIGGGGASSPAAAETGGVGGAGASISATFDVLPGQSFQGSVGGGGTNPTGGSGNAGVGTGGDGGTIGNIHRGGGGGGRTSVDLGGVTVVAAGGGGGGGAAHNTAPAGFGGGAGFAGIAAGTVSTGSNGQAGVDTATANGGQGGQAAAGGAGGTNTGNAALNGAAGGGIGVGTGGNGGPDPNFDSAGGGGGGYTGGGGGASTITDTVSGAGGGGGSSWVRATSPTAAAAAPTAISGAAGTASPAGVGPGATGSLAIDWLPCLYTLSIDKSVSSATVDAGGTVTWTVAITNTGPDPMTRGDTIDLTDLLPVGPNGPPPPEFEVLSFTVSGGTNANMARGPVTCSGVTVGSTMPATTNCSRAYSAPGAPEAPSGGLRGLDPGETITITYEQIIAATAPCATITNTASVQDRATTSGTTDVVGVIATKSDSASVTIACNGLAITKSADRATYAVVGEVVAYEYIVTNTGTSTLSGPFVVNDDRATDESCPVTASLAPAASITCTATYTVTQADLDAGSLTNIASATNGTVTSNDDSVTLTAATGPSLSLVKTAAPTTFNDAGDLITYTYLVTNTGNVSLPGPVIVTDDKATVTCPDLSTVGDLDANLDPSESVTCTASYSVTQADVDADGVTNVATASAGQVSSAVESETVTIAGAPTLRPTIPPTSTGPAVAPDSSPAALAIPVAWLVLSTLGVLTGSIVLRRRTARSEIRKS